MYEINYEIVDKIEFTKKSSMKKHLLDEKKSWEDFLVEYSQLNERQGFRFSGSHSIEPTLISESFDRLLAAIDDKAAFNRLSRRNSRSIILPPPSYLLEGILISSLFENSKKYESFSVFYWFIAANFSLQYGHNTKIVEMVKLGEQLYYSALASKVIAYGKTAPQEISGFLRKLKTQVSALDSEIAGVDQKISKFEKKLEERIDAFVEKEGRASKILTKREQKRQTTYDAAKQLLIELTDEKVRKTDVLHKLLQRDHSKNQKAMEAEFSKLRDLFYSQLRLRAPVKLWKERAVQHSKNSFWARIWFSCLTLLAVAAAAFVPFLFGDDIAKSFFREVCTSSKPIKCEETFSARGPLTIGGILTIFSLIIWAIRLQYKLFLSERHLALDASEKEAFAETYMAIKQENNVGNENEAIVLASLFRPTQDGIIKDDESSFDLSAAAIVAKQMGRSSS